MVTVAIASASAALVVASPSLCDAATFVHRARTKERYAASSSALAFSARTRTAFVRCATAPSFSASGEW